MLNGTLAAGGVFGIAGQSLGNATSAIVLGDATHTGTFECTNQTRMAACTTASGSASAPRRRNRIQHGRGCGQQHVDHRRFRRGSAGGNLTIGGATNTDFTGSVNLGTGGLIKTGGGTLYLGGSNGFTGGVTINAGTAVQLDRSGALNSVTPNSVAFTGGGTLQLAGNSVSVAGLSSTAATAVIENLSGGDWHRGGRRGHPHDQRAQRRRYVLRLAARRHRRRPPGPRHQRRRDAGPGRHEHLSGATTVNAGVLMIGAANALSPARPSPSAAARSTPRQGLRAIRQLAHRRRLGDGESWHRERPHQHELRQFERRAEPLRHGQRRERGIDKLPGLLQRKLLDGQQRPGLQAGLQPTQLDLVELPTGPSAWASAVSGSWSTGPWTGGVPSGCQRGAAFSGSANTAVTVTLDAPQTVGTLVFGNTGSTSTSYTLSGSTLTLNNSGRSGGISMVMVLSGTHAISAPVQIAGGSLVVSAVQQRHTWIFPATSRMTTARSR